MKELRGEGYTTWQHLRLWTCTFYFLPLGACSQRTSSGKLPTLSKDRLCCIHLREGLGYYRNKQGGASVPYGFIPLSAEGYVVSSSKSTYKASCHSWSEPTDIERCDRALLQRQREAAEVQEVSTCNGPRDVSKDVFNHVAFSEFSGEPTLCHCRVVVLVGEFESHELC